MKKLKVILLFVLSSFIFMMSCRSEKEQPPSSKSISLNLKKKMEQEIKINITTEPGTLDPRKARSLNDVNVIKMLMEGLTRIDFNNNPEKALAEKIEVSEDNKTYTITLKKTKWSTGDNISSEDFVYAWKKELSPSFPCDQANLLYVIKNAKQVKEGSLPSSLLGLEAPNETTLIVELEKPIPYFLELLAQPAFFPIHAKTDKENSAWAEKSETYVGCGPFKISKWKHHNFIEMTKNEKYWDAKNVSLKKIEIMMVSPETGLQMYEKKELDWEGSPLSFLPLDAISKLDKSDELKTQPFLITSFLRTNTKRAPFNSIHIRKAFAIALERQSIIDHILGGSSLYASGLIPKSFGLSEEEYFHDGNGALAKDLLEKGKKEEKLSSKDFSQITLSFFSTEKNYRICQALQQQWKKVFGFDIKLEPLEGKVFFSKMHTKDYQLALGSWVADFRDPINFLEVFRNKDVGTNNTQWENIEYLTKLEKSYELTDSIERNKLLQDCEKILMEEMPIIPLYHGKMSYVKRDQLKNVIVSETGGIDFKWAFIDKEI